MKATSIFVILTGILLAFQNCGQTARNANFLEQEALLSGSQCDEPGVCVSDVDYLWLAIREYEPYRIDITTVTTHFNVGGQCGVGTFRRHSFLWVLQEGFGAQNIVGQGFEDDRCVNGQFIIPIIPNQMNLQPNQRYTLTLELVGITDTNSEVTNPAPNNVGTLDILFTTSPP